MNPAQIRFSEVRFAESHTLEVAKTSCTVRTGAPSCNDRERGRGREKDRELRNDMAARKIVGPFEIFDLFVYASFCGCIWVTRPGLSQLPVLTQSEMPNLWFFGLCPGSTTPDPTLPTLEDGMQLGISRKSDTSIREAPFP